MAGQLAAPVDGKRATIIDKLILTPDHIHIDNRQFGLDGTRDGVQHPLVCFACFKRGCVQRDDHLRPRLRQTFDHIRRPYVLADWKAKPQAANHDRSRHRASDKIPLVIKNAVVRQIDLVTPTKKRATIKHKNTIIDNPAFCMGRADDNRWTTIFG